MGPPFWKAIYYQGLEVFQGFDANETIRNVSRAIQGQGRWVNQPPLNSPVGGFLDGGEGLVLMSGARWKGQQPHDGHRVQPVSTRGLVLDFSFFTLFCQCILCKVYATYKIQRKTVSGNQSQQAGFLGLRGPPQRFPDAVLTPRVGKDGGVRAWACTLSPQGLYTVCSFCQNACPQTPMCSAEQASLKHHPREASVNLLSGSSPHRPPDPLLLLLGTWHDWIVSRGSGCSYFPVLPHRGQEEAEHQDLIEHARSVVRNH